jgi:WD40 repeat protein
MARPGVATVTAITLAVLTVLVGLWQSARAIGWSNDIRFVPQLEITDLHPVQVRFAPNEDDALLMVVNQNGRIDVLDISNPDAPVKVTEIQAGAADAGFTPGRTRRDDIRIASGGFDGTVRLWTLDGKPAAEPFKGHEGLVWSVAVSPDGTRIVSGGEDGTVRLWTLDGKPTAQPFKGHEDWVRSVAFSPDGTRIVSGGGDGTVRLWTLDGSPAAEPFKGHEGVVSSVAFSPDGTRIVSGGEDGTVRLWTLDGKPAAQPFKGHEGWAQSVAFLPVGTRIVSGGWDGTVRLWNTATGTSTELPACRSIAGLGFSGSRFFWIGCSDRIRIESIDFEPRGELFLNEAGLAALVYREGVLVPSDRLKQPFRAVAPGGQILWQHGLLPELPLSRVKQVLFDDWTLRERVIETARTTYAAARQWLTGLGWWNAAFWPALGWIVAVLVALAMWIAVPRRLAHWAMRPVGRPDLPKWAWLTDVLLLFGYLGTSRRALDAWLRSNRAALLEQTFAGRDPVRERRAYADLSRRAEIERLAALVADPGGVRVWITGTGGSGKSALAYRILLLACERSRFAPLPVLIDEDWDGAIAEHIARQLVLGDRGPTARMVEVLGSRNLLCPLIDQLSERGMPDATKRVAEAIQSGTFRSMLVTSRKPKGDGKAWEGFEMLTARPLTRDEVPPYIDEYVPSGQGEEVSGRLTRLIENRTDFSPLFLRFAIEQALQGPLTATGTRDLVLHYVEALRKGRIDLDADDMLRAAAIVATESVRETLAPREVGLEYLRGILRAEADTLPFQTARRDKVVNPAEVIEMLIVCSLLTRNQINRKLQFAYDPVAEHLYAWRVEQGAASGQSVPLRERVRASPDTALARTIADHEDVQHAE